MSIPLLNSETSMSDLHRDPVIFDPGGGDPVLAPLYDEIAIMERIVGDALAMEQAAANGYLNEFLSGFRHPTAATAALAEVATADVTVGEQMHGTAIVFEH